MPAPAPRVYTAFIAVMVTLFGATYGWLARQPEIDRPQPTFSALGKTGFSHPRALPTPDPAAVGEIGRRVEHDGLPGVDARGHLDAACAAAADRHRPALDPIVS